ncbi:SDR family NAD(P)-dependent oxidoreductase [Nocardia bovistercoris]|uniref:SDR family NAD(P)-dependent oxidoreductase n=1 Tax=Nocardia bovistercoris TaxID=2785916 RepID=A0A931N5D2_9NOCA|nr:SDR family NAD(P)-dependent oxidoreductase [Nocardia bovistercoris]MBH0779704.1 SDR family NAD(P)-dependent oxidoreductase [Nocardia bovistercoris]
MGLRGGRGIAEGPVLILGGRSEIGVEVARRLAPGRVVVLAARAGGSLDEQVAVLTAAGAEAVHTVEFDGDDVTSHAALLEKIDAEYGGIGVAVLAFGKLGDQARAEQDPAHALEVVHTDYVAQISVLTTLANLMRARGSGQLVVFSSVAGARVRRANYVYGSAKAGLDGFATGLAAALHGSGVHLMLLRPGFVIGKMTEGMSPAPFSSTPAQVADATVRGLHRRSVVVWVPRALQLLCAASRFAPHFVWRRLPR